MAGTSFRWHFCSKDDFPLKRHKVTKACNTCRNKKMRCDGKSPCSRCRDSHVECEYDETPRKSAQVHKRNRNLTSDLDHDDDLDKTSLTTKQVRTSSPEPERIDDKEIHSKTTNLLAEDLSYASSSDDVYQRLREKNPQQPCLYHHLTPLLFDFFNITSEPASVWNTFFQLFRVFIRQKCHTSAMHLVEEGSRLFDNFNALYREAMQPMQGLAHDHLVDLFISSSSPDTGAFSLEDTLLCAAMSLMLYAATQSLVHRDLVDDVHGYATLFYQEAQHQFMTILFPASSTPLEPSAQVILTQIAVLLTHIQSVYVCAQQAFTMCTLATGLARQSGLSRSKTASNRVLLRLAQGWMAWLSLYLSPDTLADDHGEHKLYRDDDAQATWGVRMLDQHVWCLYRLLRRNDVDRSHLTLQDVQHRLKHFPNHDDLAANPLKTMDGLESYTHLGALALALYRAVLMIQLGQGQLRRTQSRTDDLIFSPCSCTLSSVPCCHTIAIDLCVAAAEHIAELVCDGTSQASMGGPCPMTAQRVYAASLATHVLTLVAKNPPPSLTRSQDTDAMVTALTQLRSFLATLATVDTAAAVNQIDRALESLALTTKPNVKANSSATTLSLESSWTEDMLVLPTTAPAGHPTPYQSPQSTDDKPLWEGDDLNDKPLRQSMPPHSMATLRSSNYPEFRPYPSVSQGYQTGTKRPRSPLMSGESLAMRSMAPSLDMLSAPQYMASNTQLLNYLAQLETVTSAAAAAAATSVAMVNPIMTSSAEYVDRPILTPMAMSSPLSPKSIMTTVPTRLAGSLATSAAPVLPSPLRTKNPACFLDLNAIQAPKSDAVWPSSLPASIRDILNQTTTARATRLESHATVSVAASLVAAPLAIDGSHGGSPIVTMATGVHGHGHLTELPIVSAPWMRPSSQRQYIDMIESSQGTNTLLPSVTSTTSRTLSGRSNEDDVWMQMPQPATPVKILADNVSWAS